MRIEGFGSVETCDAGRARAHPYHATRQTTTLATIGVGTNGLSTIDGKARAESREGRSEPLWWLPVHVPERMFIQQVWFDTPELLTVIDLNSDVII
jgi:hypothetical protein